MKWVRAHPDPEPEPADWRISIHGSNRWSTLAQYNSERARGLVHTAEWEDLMKEEQRKFNEWTTKRLAHA